MIPEKQLIFSASSPSFSFRMSAEKLNFSHIFPSFPFFPFRPSVYRPFPRFKSEWLVGEAEQKKKTKKTAQS